MLDIQSLISLPEGKTLEFKRDLSSLTPIMKTLIAFANTAGGTLIIGKSDDGSIVGIKDIFEAEEKLANAVADSIHPALTPEIEISSIGGKSLLVIRVPHWRAPFYLKMKGMEEGVFIRLGSTNRLASPELLEELKRSVLKASFDQLPCPETSIKDLNRGLIDQLFSGVGKQADVSKLESLGVLVPYAGRSVCSNGGLILFGLDLIRQTYFPNSTVRCAMFRGIEKVDFIDQQDTKGTIIEAMSEVTSFIQRNTRLASKIESMKRKDIPEYPSVALREVLTNALVHADYSLKGMHPRIAIYSDRLEVESPGMLPFGYTMEDFKAGVSHIRNKVIARVFRELNLMEEWGTGYKRISETCKLGGYLQPEWQELGMTIRVLFRPHSSTRLEEESIKLSEMEGLTFRQQKIVNLLSEEDRLSAKEIHHLLGEDVSERSLRNDLLFLKEKEFLNMLGSGPSTKWTIQK